MDATKTAKWVYMNEARELLLRRARRLWPKKSDSDIIWTAVEEMVVEAETEVSPPEPARPTDEEPAGHSQAVDALHAQVDQHHASAVEAMLARHRND